MLDSLPQDILEHIAYHASTHTLLGPPSDLASLLALSRSTSASLRRSTNPHLYASIFTAKFDVTAPQRRLALLYGSHPRSALSVNALAEELVRRFTILKRLRAELDARSSDSSATGSGNTTVPDEADSRLDELLWTAFLMVLEDAGRNTAQLRNARIEAWLAVYWFDARGASGAIHKLACDRWPLTPSYSKDSGQKIRHALAMWLFWFFLNPAAYVVNPDIYRRAEKILKLVTLNAPRYPLSHFAWTSFRPEPTRVHFGVPGTSSSEPVDPHAPVESHSQQPTSGSPARFKYFGRELPHLNPLPLAVPASLALLALHTRSRRNADALEGGPGLFELIGPSLTESFIAFSENLSNAGQGETHSLLDEDEGITSTIDASSLGASSRDESIVHADSYRWDIDWLRCVYAVSENGSYPGGLVGQGENLARNMDTGKYKTYQLGSLEGSWEGPFTYTEFHSFASLLSGAKPSKLHDCLIAQHNQTWRLREYHLLAPTSSCPKYPSGSLSQASGIEEEPIPLPVGDAICAHLPDGVTYEDNSATLHLTLPSSFSPPPSLPSTSPEPLPRTYTYTRCRGYRPSDSRGGTNGRAVAEEEDEETYSSRVVDILLSGEGHSGWGEFTFLGRVRPADGLIYIMKKYTGGDRGRWLYRGYLVGAGTAYTISPPEFDGEGVGGSKGYISGRWRDMHTPAGTHGYEGAFAMARRR